VRAFIETQLPPLPARVLEVGCGGGELARSLAARGYEVTAIDPRAPEGFIFRQVALEQFDEPGPFDAVVARVALHHVKDLPGGVRKLAGLLRPGGVLALEEFARDRIDEPTARWYFHQRQARAALGLDDPLPAAFGRWWPAWKRKHSAVHTSDEMREALDRHFEERAFGWTPYLHAYRLDEAVEPLERKLIDAGAIQATGFVYAGAPRTPV
jgi:2-polyprenyl-3-methyl-5-hydroxy-6-metoxy-1,4-benzoquinol methylase